MKDLRLEQENEDIDRAIALSLLEENRKGENVIGKWLEYFIAAEHSKTSSVAHGTVL